MCVIFLAINKHPEYKFIVAANRDEFYHRPTERAHFWTENQNILAGKDLVHGGTWLGVTKNGRFAAVTNFRDPNQPQGKLSRGNLVKDYLIGSESPRQYLQLLQAHRENYTGFNLLIGDVSADVSISYYSNISNEIIKLKSGIYGLSNHLLDTDWHKVTGGKARFEAALNDLSNDHLFEILADRRMAIEEDLPDTGIGIEREKVLSSIFIETPIYGTRCSTILLGGSDGSVSFAERTFPFETFERSDKHFNFNLADR